jgi:hypothetical protein
MARTHSNSPKGIQAEVLCINLTSEHLLKGRLSTVGLLIKLACFVKNEMMFAISKAADLN